MGLFDDALGALSGASGSSGNPMVSEVMNLIQNQPGGLAGLVEKFKSGGLGDLVQSWVGTGQNQSISAEQIQQVLGSDTVQALASKVGVDPSQAAATLSQMLPQLVDKLTPNGQVPEGNLLEEGLGLLKGKLFG
ncbi:YidB family protein [Thiomonas sp. FB-Cd]|uniref:YidB family protein n=1 Tax=Thiomonas sp. FB-Cd TaxID=1158292 RepID=UPI0004DF5F70|nr:YidB family protein [Thiomonas sp. FB-Cd]